MACALFAPVLAYFIYSWDSSVDRLSADAVPSRMEMQAVSVSDLLVSSAGQPFSWTQNASAARSIGLAARPGEVQTHRVQALAAQTYADAQESLGLEYDYLIKIEGADGSRLATIGRENITGVRTVEVSRVVRWDGRVAYLRLRLYGE